ncbi:MAG TPA: hypothetical protein VIV06_10095, partial [Candidatus Limnocylindrales bacterium]
MIRRSQSGTDRPRGRPHRPHRLLIALLLLPLLGSMLGAPVPARGDELSDALARQKALAARIADQRKQVAKLTALQ